VLAPVQTDKTSESLVEIMKELRGVAGDRAIGGAEFANLKRSEVSRIPGRFETLKSLEPAAIDIINNGYPDDYNSHLDGRLRSLTEGALAAAAKQCIRPDQVIWLVVGDVKRIEKGVRAVNVGEIIRLDAHGQSNE
jgi:zinc protease